MTRHPPMRTYEEEGTEMPESKKEKFNSQWLMHVMTGCICILFYVTLTHMSTVGKIFQTLGYFVYPVFLGLVIAYVLSPIVKMLQQKVFWGIKEPTINRNLSVGIVFVILVLLLLLIVCGLVPQLFDSLMGLIHNMDSYSRSLRETLNRLVEFAAGYGIDIAEPVASASDLVQTLTSLIGANAENILMTSFNLGKAVFNFLIAFILALYLLMDRFPFQQKNHRLLRALIKPSVYDSLEQFLSQCNDIIMRYIFSEVVDAFIVCIANAIFMTVMKMPYVILVSIVVGITNLAPSFGPIVGGAIGAIILLLVNPWDALGFLIFTIILQTIDGYVIKPRLFGNMLGISSVWILASIIIGGRVLGVLGILVAIPIAAIIALLYQDYLLPKLEERRRILNRKETLKDVQGKETEKDLSQQVCEAD